MELLNREDYETILKENEVIFVFFYATWCPPCKMLKPIVEEYMENYPDNAFLLINTDNFKDIHKSYDIHNVPTILCFKNGEIVDKAVGVRTKEEYQNMIKNAL